MDISQLKIRQLTREEFDIAVKWAAAEGWNPGFHDADVFWLTDPEGFLGAELDGELVASGSIVSYDGRYGFMGFFIVRPDLRGQGIGTKLWFHRRDTLKARLDVEAAIGMDGVFDMQDWYAKGGFKFSHRNLRMEGVGQGSERHELIVPVDALPFENLAAYDEQRFGCHRRTFLKAWIEMPKVAALAYVEEGNILGYGVIRPCREGYKIGPLFAEEAAVAEALFDALSNQAVDEAIFLDIPEINEAAMQLAAQRGMKEVFGCARMYYGIPVEIDWSRIFGITTFELG